MLSMSASSSVILFTCYSFLFAYYGIFITNYTVPYYYKLTYPIIAPYSSLTTLCTCTCMITYITYITYYSLLRIQTPPNMIRKLIDVVL